MQAHRIFVGAFLTAMIGCGDGGSDPRFSSSSSGGSGGSSGSGSGGSSGSGNGGSAQGNGQSGSASSLAGSGAGTSNGGSATSMAGNGSGGGGSPASSAGSGNGNGSGNGGGGSPASTGGSGGTGSESGGGGSASTAGTGSGSGGGGAASGGTGPGPTPGWKLVWSDEFEGTGLPNPANWGYERGYVRNSESQYYTVGRLENSRLEDGKLIIEARLENWEGYKYTSASIITRDKQWFQYGRVELSARLPRGKGTWSALWMLGKNRNESVGWPRCGEIDIMENVGWEGANIHSTLHTFQRNGGNGIGFAAPITDPWDTFHVYAVEWYADRIDMYVDQTKVQTYVNDGANNVDTWPFNQQFYLLINMAIGGTFGGYLGPTDDASFPNRMYVDYVRYYQAQ